MKNIAENIKSAGLVADFGNTGCKPTEKEILAVRGVANNGPKVKWIKTINARAKLFPKGLPIS